MSKDSLYRVSFKCLIFNEENQVLVVKERSRHSWDLPGGGIEHGETIHESIARELHEEVAFTGGFRWSVIKAHDPGKLLTRDVWQIRIVILVDVDDPVFNTGNEADAIKFVDPSEFNNSDHESESIICEYVELATAFR